MLEHYEQHRVPASQTSEADSRIVGGATDKGMSKVLINEQVGHGNTSLAGGSSRSGTLKPPSAHLDSEPVDNHNSLLHCVAGTPNNIEHEEHRVSGPSPQRDDGEDDHRMTCGSAWDDANDDKQRGYGEQEGNKSHKSNIVGKESVTMQSTPAMIKKFDEDKLKQLREKRKKSRGDAVRRTDTMDEFDPIVKELEEGVELAAAESEKSKQERKQSWSQPPRLGNENSHHSKYADAAGDEHQLETKANYMNQIRRM